MEAVVIVCAGGVSTRLLKEVIKMSSSVMSSSSAEVMMTKIEPTPPTTKQQQPQNHNGELVFIEKGCANFDSAHETIVQVGSDLRQELANALISNILLVLGITSVIVAWMFPTLGAAYVRPEITASWIAVIIIFFISGLSMDTATIIHAGRKFRFNAFIQLFNFLFVSAICWLFSLLMVQYEVIPNPLAKGVGDLFLPTTIHLFGDCANQVGGGGSGHGND